MTTNDFDTLCDILHGKQRERAFKICVGTRTIEDIKKFYANHIIAQKIQIRKYYKEIEKLTEKSLYYKKLIEEAESLGNIVDTARYIIACKEYKDSIIPYRENIKTAGSGLIDLIQNLKDYYNDNEIAQITSSSFVEIEKSKLFYLPVIKKDYGFMFYFIFIYGGEYRGDYKGKSGKHFNCKKYEMPLYYAMHESLMDSNI